MVWDVAATFVDRLPDVSDFILHNIDIQNMERKITFGFKLLSGYYENSISKSSISEMGSNREIQWNSDELEKKIKNMCNALLNKSEFFKVWRKLKIALTTMTSDAAGMTYFQMLLRDWDAKGEPQSESKKQRLFIKNAKVLFDRIIFEYVSGIWKGSSDSKLANYIKNTPFTEDSEFSEIEDSRWNQLIDGAIEHNKINNNLLSETEIKALLCYYYILSPKNLDLESEVPQIDHIIRIRSRLHIKSGGHSP